LALSAAVSLSQESPGAKPEFFWAECIGYGEFKMGWYAPESTLTALGRRQLRSEDPIYRFVISSVSNRTVVSRAEIEAFDKQIDDTGRDYENRFQMAVKSGELSERSEYLVSDLCQY
jgi:hypothetical protein